MIWKLALHWQVFIGMIAGAAVALLAPDLAPAAATLGTIFMRLLRMVIVPLIFTSIVSGVAGIGDPRSLGRLGAKTLAYYLCTSLFAILVGLVLANGIRPGAQLHPPEGVVISPDQIERPGSLAEILIRMIPENPIQAASEGDILGLIFFALAFGLAIMFLPERGRTFLTEAFQTAFEAMMKLTGGLIRLAPLGVLGLIAGAISTMGFGVFAQVAKYMLTVALGLSFHFFVVLPALYFLLTRRSPVAHWRAMVAPMQLAFSTSSSSATLPVTMNTVERKAGVSNKVASFVLPLGATVNMDGTALYECAGVLFIAQALDVGLTVGQQAMVVLTALLASIGAAGIPSAGLVMIFIVLEAVNLSNPAAFALVGVMLAVDRPLDMFRTMVNVTSDTVGAAVIAQSEGETLRYDDS
ncbi:MAG TPA: dicarboxylate/amino acid:cation symporter [Thermoanaerobaculia bacterium]|nr:dicarboxylate/amino acid:cation symporter [Thermoanaerobaculia bacterium]